MNWSFSRSATAHKLSWFDNGKKQCERFNYIDKDIQLDMSFHTARNLFLLSLTISPRSKLFPCSERNEFFKVLPLIYQSRTERCTCFVRWDRQDVFFFSNKPSTRGNKPLRVSIFTSFLSFFVTESVGGIGQLCVWRLGSEELFLINEHGNKKKKVCSVPANDEGEGGERQAL